MFLVFFVAFPFFLQINDKGTLDTKALEEFLKKVTPDKQADVLSLWQTCSESMSKSATTPKQILLCFFWSHFMAIMNGVIFAHSFVILLQLVCVCLFWLQKKNLLLLMA